VLRDLLVVDELVGRPRSDIAAEELEMLLRSDRGDEFPVTSLSQLSVELEPGVWTVVNCPRVHGSNDCPIILRGIRTPRGSQ